MTVLRVIAKRLSGLFHRDRHDAELREELESLAAIERDERLASGASPDEARRHVLARTGSITSVQEVVRRRRALGWLDDLVRDVRGGLRLLRRQPLLAAVIILSLGLGLGANAAIFAIVDHLMLRTLPVAHADRLLIVDDHWSYPIWERMRLEADRVDGLATWFATRMVVSHDGTSSDAQVLYVSGDYFDVLGVTPVLGRLTASRDDVRGGGPDGAVAVISDGYWTRAFGRDPGAIGHTLLVKRVPFTIVGVTPPAFFGTEVGRTFDVAVPFGTEPLLEGTSSNLDRQSWQWLSIAVRRRSNQTIDDVQQIVQSLRPALRDVAPPDDHARIDTIAVADGSSGRSELRSTYRDALLILLVAAVAVLLVTCANVANLLLARAHARRSEMSARLALGASRGRLLRQLLTENLVLSAGGACAAVMTALVTARLFVSQLSTPRIPVSLDIPMDARLLVFVAGCALLVMPLFGLWPALRTTRLVPLDAMKEQTRSVVGDRAHATSDAFVVAQIALSLALVGVAALLVRTFVGLATMPLGVESARIVTASVTLDANSVPESERAPLLERLRAAVAAVPGVTETALSAITPLSGMTFTATLRDIDGMVLSGSEEARRSFLNQVSDGFFATYGMPLRDGRDISTTDTAEAPRVVVVNDAFVRTFMGGGRAVGRQVRQGTARPDDVGGPPIEIIGVVGDAVYHNLHHGVGPTMYVPAAQQGLMARTFVNVAARTRAAEASTLVEPVRRAVEGVDGRLTARVLPHTTLVRSAIMRERLVATVATVFGSLALLVAVVGLYGVTAYTVSRRRGEIGLRLALGATPARVLRLVLGRVVILVIVGVVAGIGLTLWAGRAVRTLLAGLEPGDPATLAGAALLLIVTAGLAALIPATRAARIPPAAALRE